MQHQSECAFCIKVLPAREFLAESERCAAFLDGYPCADGHVLIVPKRCVSRVWELTYDEWREMSDLCHNLLSRDPNQQWNIGVNDGPSAGQTISHVHMHLIPRTAGDVEDPRGGVRWVKPDKARYW